MLYKLLRAVTTVKLGRTKKWGPGHQPGSCMDISLAANQANSQRTYFFSLTPFVSLHHVAAHFLDSFFDFFSSMVTPNSLKSASRSSTGSTLASFAFLPPFFPA